jgi:hypothetical protein
MFAFYFLIFNSDQLLQLPHQRRFGLVGVGAAGNDDFKDFLA